MHVDLNMCFKINRTYTQKNIREKKLRVLTDSPVCLDLGYFQRNNKTVK